MKKIFDVFLSIKDSEKDGRIGVELKKAGFKVIQTGSDCSIYPNKKVKKAINESRIFLAFWSHGLKQATGDLKFAFDTRAEIVFVLLDKFEEDDKEDWSSDSLSQIVRASIVYDFHATNKAPTSEQLNFLFGGLSNILGYQVNL